jgi:hypothetical protein
MTFRPREAPGVRALQRRFGQLSPPGKPYGVPPLDIGPVCPICLIQLSLSASGSCRKLPKVINFLFLPLSQNSPLLSPKIPACFRATQGYLSPIKDPPGAGVFFPDLFCIRVHQCPSVVKNPFLQNEPNSEIQNPLQSKEKTQAGVPLRLAKRTQFFQTMNSLREISCHSCPESMFIRVSSVAKNFLLAGKTCLSPRFLFPYTLTIYARPQDSR